VVGYIWWASQQVYLSSYPQLEGVLHWSCHSIWYLPLASHSAPLHRDRAYGVLQAWPGRV